MPSQPLISTIIPVYNNERFLGEALESVITQDYEPLEVIVVDDGSTDATAQVAQSYEGVRYLHQANSGPAAARNLGILSAQGEYMAFLDSDDLWRPHKLKLQMAFLLDRPDYGFSFTLMHSFLQEGVERPGWFRPEHEQDYPGMTAPTMLARRSVFDEVGLYDPEFFYGENADWLARAKERGMQYGLLEEPLYLRRVHARNVSHALDVERSAVILAVKRSLDRRRKGQAG